MLPARRPLFSLKQASAFQVKNTRRWGLESTNAASVERSESGDFPSHAVSFVLRTKQGLRVQGSPVAGRTDSIPKFFKRTFMLMACAQCALALRSGLVHER